jgi:hypothetical protein
LRRMSQEGVLSWQRSTPSARRSGCVGMIRRGGA